MSDDVLVKVEGISKKYCRDLKKSLMYGLHDVMGEFTGYFGRNAQLRPKEFWAVDDVSFELKRGECLGLIGRNGAGKSTLLKMLNGLVKPDKGKITIRGRVGALIELGAGFNPILTGRENVYINGAVLGFSKQEMDKRFDAIVDYAEIQDYIDMPVQSYSSGMKVRLGFAIAAQMEPDVLIIDEVLAVGDVGFRQKCHKTIIELTQKCAVILVSHSLHILARDATELLVFDKGQKIYFGKDIAQGIEKYFSVFPEESIKKFGTENIRLNHCSVHGENASNPDIQYLDDMVVDLDITYLKENCADVLFLSIFDSESQYLAETFVDLPDHIRKMNKSTQFSIKILQNRFRTGKYALYLSFVKKIKSEPKGAIVSQFRPATYFNVVGSNLSTNAPVVLQAEIC